MKMKRRAFLITGLSVVAVGPALAEGSPIVQVVKSPTCGCCSAWVDHLEAEGFAVEARDVDQEVLDALKSRLGITRDLASCHTAMVGDYFVEGHVPAADIRRLLAERPDARGLTVPGMPMGSPGMDFSSAREAYDTLLVGSGGAVSVFASHV
jgi:hypothetical protein